MMKIAHIVNPLIVAPSSDLYTAQPITFETMKVAKAFAESRVDVQLFTTQYPEDHEIIPAWFKKTPDLERSVLDLDVFQIPRKLPILRDILDRLYYATPDADYLIYTNVDIAIQPNFYTFVNRIIEAGYDGFVINRRTISDIYTKVEDLPWIYAQAGVQHPGHDCFVFSRNQYKQFFLGDLCIGAEKAGKALLLNLLYSAQKFYEFKELHLTFHLGNEQSWKSTTIFDYDAYNNRELAKVYAHYDAIGALSSHPLIKQCKPWSDDEVRLARRGYYRWKLRVGHPAIQILGMYAFRFSKSRRLFLRYWQKQ